MRKSIILSGLLFLPLAVFAASELIPDPTWSPQLPEGWNFRMVSNIAGDSQGRIYVAHRGAHPLLCFDKQGKFIRSLGDDIFEQSVNLNLTVDPPIPISREYWLHGLHVDPSDNIWVTDLGRHLVMKLSPEGKLLMTLGTPGKSGTDKRTFHQPSSVAVSPTGHIYVADGYGNSRVVKFSPDGKFMKAWGRKGAGPGEFDTPHCIAVDSKGNVYVVGRSNNRVQVFDPDGKLLETRHGFESPNSIAISSDGTVFVGTGQGKLRLTEFDPSGKRLETFGDPEVMGYPHGIFVDDEGRFYVADPVFENAAKPPRRFIKKTSSSAQ